MAAGDCNACAPRQTSSQTIVREAAVFRFVMPVLGLSLVLGGLLAPATAATLTRPVVVELFTSQGCSSCPPADALLRDLAQNRADVLPLAFHVTYWNQLGWHDPYSLNAGTARQASYNRLSAYGGSYTPQMVVDGRIDVVGSDRPAVIAALRTAQPGPPIALTLARDGSEVAIDLGAGVGEARILLVGYDPEHRTTVPRGENAGATLVEANIVRDLQTIGAWRGAALHLRHLWPQGEHIAVLLQTSGGTFLAAGSL